MIFQLRCQARRWLMKFLGLPSLRSVTPGISLASDKPENIINTIKLSCTYELNSGLIKGWKYGEYNSDKTVVFKNKNKPKFDNIFVTNNCQKKVKFAIRLKDYKTGSWITDAWFNISTNESAFVGETSNSIIYYYAKDSDEGMIWSGESPKDVDGRTYSFIKSKITTENFGNWNISLNCN